MSPSRRRRRASPAWEGRPTITVAALPGRGLYARHLGHPEGVDAVHRPTVAPHGAAPRHSTFEETWLRQHLPDVDVVHVHGIPPGRDPDEIAAAADAVKDAGRPLVVTGYHLSDPSGRDPDGYAASLDALVTRADRVVTLTPGAAQEMDRRWGVKAEVLPHPHAVDFVRMRQDRPGPRRTPFLVGVHLGALALPVDPVVLVTALVRALRGIDGAILVVHLHETVLDPGSATYAPDTVRRIDQLVRSARGLLRVHRPYSDSQLWDHLFGLDVSVVPGLFGSHSIWPEACADLGTQVLLPAGSHAAGQRPCLTYDLDLAPDGQGGGDLDAFVDSLAKALWTAREQGCVWRSDPLDRWSERVRISEGLRSLYEQLLGLDRR